MIPYGKHFIDDEDINAVSEILRSQNLTCGPKVPQFEEAVEKFCGVNHCIATNSATSALHLACLSLDVKCGDIVWIPAITYVATANCVLNCSASLDFVDINIDSYNIDYDALRNKLELVSNVKKLPKVVIVVHMAGQPCEMDKIYELSKLYGFDIVEDASHAFGARFGSRVIGDCSFSKVTVFSFHPVKIITTGEGGACTTNDSRIAKKMQIIRSNGVTAQKFYNQNHESCEIWNYEQIYPGFNYRMNDIEAALGISQLKKAEKILNKRTRLANWYYNNLDNLPIILPKQNKNVQSSWHLFIVKLQRTEHILNKTEVFRKLHNLGIGVNLHYIPVYRHPVFSKMGFSRGYCKEAEKYFKAAISLPIFYTMTEDECQTILRCLNNVLK